MPASLRLRRQRRTRTRSPFLDVFWRDRDRDRPSNHEFAPCSNRRAIGKEYEGDGHEGEEEEGDEGTGPRDAQPSVKLANKEREDSADAVAEEAEW